MTKKAIRKIRTGKPRMTIRTIRTIIAKTIRSRKTRRTRRTLKNNLIDKIDKKDLQKVQEEGTRFTRIILYRMGGYLYEGEYNKSVYNPVLLFLVLVELYYSLSRFIIINYKNFHLGIYLLLKKLTLNLFLDLFYFFIIKRIVKIFLENNIIYFRRTF